jgi:hypothetical protein
MVGLQANHIVSRKGKAASSVSPCSLFALGRFFQDSGAPTLVGQIPTIFCGCGGASPRFMTRYTLYCPNHAQFSAACLLN